MEEIYKFALHCEIATRHVRLTNLNFLFKNITDFLLNFISARSSVAEPEQSISHRQYVQDTSVHEDHLSSATLGLMNDVQITFDSEDGGSVVV